LEVFCGDSNKNTMFLVYPLAVPPKRKKGIKKRLGSEKKETVSSFV
jgi:hypothetical protein